MITVNDESIPFEEGMSARDAIETVGADPSPCIVLVNDIITSDAHDHILSDGDVIRLLKLVSGG